MGCSKSPVISSPEEGLDGRSLTTKPSGGSDVGRAHGAKSFEADHMTFPSVSPRYTHFRQHDMHGARVSSLPECQNRHNDFNGCGNLNFLNDFGDGENLINAKSNMPYSFRESEPLYPDANMGELCLAVDGNRSASSDCMLDTDISSMYYKPELQRNLRSTRCETITGYPIKVHGAEAKKVKVGWSQTNGKIYSSECSTSVPPPVNNYFVTGKEGMNILPFPFSTPHKVDGDFLTLGVGSSAEIRPNSNFSFRGIASNLEDSVPSSLCNSHLIGQSPNSNSSFTQLTSRAARIQSNSDGLSSSACNFGGRVSTFDEGRFIGNARAGLTPTQFPGFQTAQANSQSHVSAKYDNVMFNQNPSSFPSGRALVSQPEHKIPILLGPEVRMTTHGQSISQQQVHCGKFSMNVSAESSRNDLSGWPMGSSINHAQLGKLFPLAEGRGIKHTGGVHFQPPGYLTSPAKVTNAEVPMLDSSPSSVQRAGHLRTSQSVHSVGTSPNSLFPQRVGFPMPNGSSFQYSAGSSFPKRLGVQATEYATGQTTKDHFQMPVQTPFASGLPTNVAPHVNPFRPSPYSGQHHGIPIQPSNDLSRVDSPYGRIAPVAKCDVRPLAPPINSRLPLKRPATDYSMPIHAGQHRKFFPHPVRHQNPLYSRQSIPSPIPSSPLYVKWQGCEEPLKPSGHKCELCKRDLSFLAEGPYEPANPPPAVAVLACGHTFHDHCLEIITPEDQSKSPPCIPCALGET